jgi:hypothetical protein
MPQPMLGAGHTVCRRASDRAAPDGKLAASAVP